MTTFIPTDGQEHRCDHCQRGDYQAWHIGDEGRAHGPYRGPEWVVVDDEGRQHLTCRFCDEDLEVKEVTDARVHG